MTPSYQLHHARPTKLSPLFAEHTDNSKRFGHNPLVTLYKDFDDRPDIWGRARDAASRLNKHSPEQATAMVLPNTDPANLRLPVHGSECILVQSFNDEQYTAELAKSLFRQGAEVVKIRTFNDFTRTIVADDMRGAA